MSEYYIGQIFEREYPQGAADFCNETQTAIITKIEPVIIEDEEVSRFQIISVPKYTPTHDEIRQMRELRFEKEADPIRYAYDEALARGEETAETLKQEWLAKKDEIRADLPYPTEE